MGIGMMLRQSQRAQKGYTTVGRNPQPKTGRPAHFDEWRKQAAVKKQLEKITVLKLAEKLATQDGQTKLASAMFRLVSGTRDHYRQKEMTVWGLSQLSREYLLGVPGFGRDSLKLIEAYLNQHNVPLVWGKS